MNIRGHSESGTNIVTRHTLPAGVSGYLVACMLVLLLVVLHRTEMLAAVPLPSFSSYSPLGSQALETKHLNSNLIHVDKENTHAQLEAQKGLKKFTSPPDL